MIKIFSRWKPGSTLLLLLSVGAHAGPPLPLVTGTDYPPFADTAMPGGGIAVRVVRAAFERVGETPRIDVLPWKRGYVMVLGGQYLATFPYIHTPERELAFHYSAPIFKGGSYLYTLPGKQFDLGNPDALKGRSLCVPHGWESPAQSSVTVAVSRGEFRLERPADLAGCMRMVAAGRVDGFTALEALMSKVSEDVALSGRFERAAEPVQVVELALIAPRNNPGSAALLARFNQGLKLLKADGSYKRLLEGG